MKKTKIEWCDSTWNPVSGCFHNCEYCYARKIAERFEPHGDRIPSELCAEWDIASEEQPGVRMLDKPVIGMAKDGTTQVYAYPYGFKPTLYRYRLDEPARWTRPRTIFVCSMADLFGDWVPDEWIAEVFSACKKAPQHTYLFLTKNPGRYGQLLNFAELPQGNNFWYGSTAEKPGKPVFTHPGYNTFVSIEPILGPFDNNHGKSGRVPAVDWVIIGAETGKRKEKVTPEKEWIDIICKQAETLGQPVFMKDSLIPIMGEENMKREFPWDIEYHKWEGAHEA